MNIIDRVLATEEKLKIRTEYRLQLKGGPGGNRWVEMARKGPEKEGKGAEEGEREELRLLG